MTSREVPVVGDIPCVQQEDQTGHVWAFLDEPRDSSPIVQDPIVVAVDDVDPAFAQVVSLTPNPDGTKVHLGIRPATRSSTPKRSLGRTSCRHDRAGTGTALRRSLPPVLRSLAGFSRDRPPTS